MMMEAPVLEHEEATAGEPATPVEERESPAPAARKSGGAPSRTYVVLEQHTFEDDQSPYFVEVHRVEARNANNAIRRAFREISGEKAREGDAVLVVVPESMWRPTPVRLSQRTTTSVAIGG